MATVIWKRIKIRIEISSQSNFKFPTDNFQIKNLRVNQLTVRAYQAIKSLFYSGDYPVHAC